MAQEPWIGLIGLFSTEEGNNSIMTKIATRPGRGL